MCARHADADNKTDRIVTTGITSVRNLPERSRYEIERDGDKVAEVSKKWFRVRDTYGVEVFDDKETVLILAVTVAVDSMSHDVG